MALHQSLLTSAAIPAIGADAGLIGACNAFAAHEIKRNDPSLTDDQLDEMSGPVLGLAEPILDGRATTPEGIAAKARATAIYLDRFNAGLTGELLASFFRDLLGLPDEEPEPEEKPKPPTPRDPADRATPMHFAKSWRQQFPAWQGELPAVDEWQTQAAADLPLLRLCRTWQLKPVAEIEEAFQLHPDTMDSTTAALGDLCGRYEKLTNLIRGEAIRYGLVQIKLGRAKL